MAACPPPPCPLEDRIALEDLASAYCNAVDRVGDLDGVLAVFAEDAVYDLSGFGLGLMQGHAFSKGTDGSLMEVKVRYLIDARRDAGV